MKKILFLLVLLPLFFACEKETEVVKEKEVIHSLSVVNNSSNPYRFRLYLSDVVVNETVLGGKESVVIDLENNKSYKWSVLQLKGYVFEPTELAGRFFSDRNRLISFP
ncbi:hypothetical protein [Capnocytophaga canis]|uniref:Lipoprotein n=1 Tax=Capnocytophaga canis TaxID=1848903 RepID=A0A0B7IMR5_9FLAO|nr:hypothetical protein [Capnocytophaga canis]CEN51914.1 exported hypothetical protein [Capnocytophaga canis]